MGKHAYLIMAHKNDFTFQTLLRLLDDERNTLFVHMDRKLKNYNQSDVEKMVSKASLIHTSKRMAVTWGGYSQIELEMLMLETATSVGNFDFYHLVSGNDLPIKPQDVIHSFFDSNAGKEFVQFQDIQCNFDDRVNLYYFFQNIIGRKSSGLRCLENISLEIQRKLKICRSPNLKLQKGANWFSITDDFARYVLNQKEMVRKVFRYSLCADELFLQTLLINSEYVNNLFYSTFDNNYYAIVRHIDWNRGEPYVFTIQDIDELKESPMMFARKFNCENGREIIDYVANNLAVSKA